MIIHIIFLIFFNLSVAFLCYGYSYSSESKTIPDDKMLGFQSSLSFLVLFNAYAASLYNSHIISDDFDLFNAFIASISEPTLPLGYLLIAIIIIAICIIKQIASLSKEQKFESQIIFSAVAFASLLCSIGLIANMSTFYAVDYKDEAIAVNFDGFHDNYFPNINGKCSSGLGASIRENTYLLKCYNGANVDVLIIPSTESSINETMDDIYDIEIRDYVELTGRVRLSGDHKYYITSEELNSATRYMLEHIEKIINSHIYWSKG